MAPGDDKDPRDPRAATASGELSAGLRAIDLFSGAGGLSAGFEWAGVGSVVAGIEIDPSAAETFSMNHPTARVYADDIRARDRVSPEIVSRDVSDIDVVLGGPMCQGVSQRGPRDPHDDRNFAFWAFAEYVRELRPKYFLMENVPAIASDVHNRQLAIAVFEELESLGYNLAAEVVCAAWFGVPQLRYRLVVMGARDSHPAFPDCVRSFVEGQRGVVEFATVGEAIMDLPPVASGSGLDAQKMPPPEAQPVSPYAAMMRRNARRLFNHWASDTAKVNLDRIAHVPEGGNWHDIPLKLLPDRFRHVRLSDHTTTYRRLDRAHPSHVVTCLCGNVTAGAFTHPTQDRAITVREAARLQGFPDRFRFSGPRSSQYKQVGNAVPALMARALVQSLVGEHQLSLSAPPWPGRISLSVLKSYPDRRLPFSLAPRYGPLFAKRVHMRRSDLAAA
jgi:DNA (cytosine-5)-methyltransferase 1